MSPLSSLFLPFGFRSFFRTKPVKINAFALGGVSGLGAAAAWRFKGRFRHNVAWITLYSNGTHAMKTLPVKTIWVTRACPGARVTAERVRALGFEALAAPLLEVRPLGGTPIDLAGVGAIAFTSANGVRAFAARSAERTLTVFAVGGATAAAAEAEGFTRVVAGDAGVEALASLIGAHRRALAGAVLHPGPAQPAGDLAGALASLGVEARSLPLYETVVIRPGAEVLARIPSLYGALLHSPKAARTLADILREVAAPNLRALCLSPAVARGLAGAAIGQIAVSPSPDEDSLLNLIAG